MEAVQIMPSMGGAKLTPQEIPQNLREAIVSVPDYHGIAKTIEFHNRRASESYLIVGYMLTLAEKQKIWEHDGAGADNFFQWCECVARIKRTSAQRRILVWKTFSRFIPSFSDLILSVDDSKLALIAPYAGKMETDNEVIDLLHNAEVNTIRDLDKNLKILAGTGDLVDCPHTGEHRVLEICCECNTVLRKEII